MSTRRSKASNGAYIKKPTEDSPEEALSNSPIKAFPENLISALNMHMLDFDKQSEHTLHLKCITHKDKTIYFRNPLKIRVRKEEQLFYLFEDALGIVVINRSFQKTLTLFQKQFYTKYLDYKKNKARQDFFQELSITKG